EVVHDPRRDAVAGDREKADLAAGPVDGAGDAESLGARAGARRREIDDGDAGHNVENTEPPSTTSVWPLMNALSSEARNTTVPSTSSGKASRRSERACMMALTWKAVMSGFACTVSLRISPGATAFTAMPTGP